MRVINRANPISWHKTSPLSQRLGTQLPSLHHPGPEVEEVPHIVAYLRSRYDGLPDYLTTAEAAYAYDRPVKAIAAAIERGKFPGVRKHPDRPHNNSANLIPIAELKAVFREFVREPVPLVRCRTFGSMTGCCNFSSSHRYAPATPAACWKPARSSTPLLAPASLNATRGRLVGGATITSCVVVSHSSCTGAQLTDVISSPKCASNPLARRAQVN